MISVVLIQNLWMEAARFENAFLNNFKGAYLWQGFDYLIHLYKTSASSFFLLFVACHTICCDLLYLMAGDTICHSQGNYLPCYRLLHHSNISMTDSALQSRHLHMPLVREPDMLRRLIDLLPRDFSPLYNKFLENRWGFWICLAFSMAEGTGLDIGD
jgi:hypothetical protein